MKAGKPHTRIILWAAAAAVNASVFPGCSRRTPPVVPPEVVAEIPHDTGSFVQGLLYNGGRLYESGGLYGKSCLCVLNASDGALQRSVPLDSRFFGEGIAKMGETLVQLTWREQTALTWSLPGLSPGKAIVYGGEGWGLTSDRDRFYMSNGSDTIFVRSRNFTVVRKIPVTLEGKPVKKLNELEFAGGKVYANVWYSDSILEINPRDGRVERIIHCAELVSRERPSSSECVLNGIAYDASERLFYLTGKKWKKIFMARIPCR